MPGLTKLYKLRAQGSYTDTYYDEYDSEDRLVLAPEKMGQAFRGMTSVSDVFGASGEQSAWAGIWAAVTAVWADRANYATTSDLKDAMTAALTGAGYTAP